MPWTTSHRRQQLPPGWRTHTRPAILTRDGYHCQWPGCTYHNPTGQGLEIDHIGDRNDHRHANLRTLCGQGTPSNHHGTRSATQGNAAKPRRRRPARQHPGLL
jgi:5-methylcytosine-specific restriction enzyme A